MLACEERALLVCLRLLGSACMRIAVLSCLAAPRLMIVARKMRQPLCPCKILFSARHDRAPPTPALAVAAPVHRPD